MVLPPAQMQFTLFGPAGHAGLSLRQPVPVWPPRVAQAGAQTPSWAGPEEQSMSAHTVTVVASLQMQFTLSGRRHSEWLSRQPVAESPP